MRLTALLLPRYGRQDELAQRLANEFRQVLVELELHYGFKRES